MSATANNVTRLNELLGAAIRKYDPTNVDPVRARRYLDSVAACLSNKGFGADDVETLLERSGFVREFRESPKLFMHSEPQETAEEILEAMQVGS